MLLLDYFFKNITRPRSSDPSPSPMQACTGAQTRADALASAVSERAASLFAHRKLLCAEAILVAVNETFGRPLTEDQAVGAAAGLTAGLGDRGCLCGAVAGACLVVGLLCACGPRAASRAAVRRASADIHKAFTEQHKSACCRVLTKAVKDDASAHAAQCARLTGFGAALAVRAILRLRPELLDQPTTAARPCESWLCGRLRWLLSLLCR